MNAHPKEVKDTKHDRFKGRYEAQGRRCEAPACGEAGEFRAPGARPPGFDGPGQWRWFCLDHVREFNAGYDWFEGMSAEEILEAQHPVAGWRRESRAFSPDGGVGAVPRWADFDDPLEAIGARASDIRRRAAGRYAADQAQIRFTPREREALGVMGLAGDADRSGLRKRYSELVRKYHPDRNGGDRSHEGRLIRVVEAYQILKKSTALA
ncbi:MAG TPA: J domain-containing protein [Sphingomonadaceae bacterium]|nr:J domain-containing protein [Sphingomonadaceae bacterium]